MDQQSVDIVVRSYAERRERRRARVQGPTLLSTHSSLYKKPAKDPIVIAIVGTTGTGKSSFIRRVTGRDDILVGEGLCSATSYVQEYEHKINRKSFTLIDTPGFDDTEVDDEDIFEKLAEYLETSYRKGQKLSGLIYLHRISSNREKGSDLRNLRMFQKLCGENNFANILIGMTWWDKEKPEIVAAREKVLRESDMFWGSMISGGARVARIPFEAQSCISLIESIVSDEKMTLRIQEEMVLENKAAADTGAAAEMTNYQQMQAIRDFEDLEMAVSFNRHQEESAKQDAWLSNYRGARQVSFQQKLKQQAIEFHKFVGSTGQDVAGLFDDQPQHQHSSYEIRAAYEELEQQCEILKHQQELLRREREREEVETVPKRKDTLCVRADLQRSVIAHMRQLAFDMQVVTIYLETNRSRQRTSQTLSDDDWWRRSSVFCDVCKRHGPFMMDLWCCKICLQNIAETKARSICCNDPTIESLADHFTAVADARDVTDPFTICSECKNTDHALKSCTVQGHEMTPWRGTEFPASSRDEYAMLRDCGKWTASKSVGLCCRACGDLVDCLFFHCCECPSDDFDLCAKCYLHDGRTCLNPGGHQMHMMMWCPARS